MWLARKGIKRKKLGHIKIQIWKFGMSWGSVKTRDSSQFPISERITRKCL